MTDKDMSYSSSQQEIDAALCAEKVVRSSGSSFFWAMRCLPMEKRQAMFAVYAFCRKVDDIADEVGAEQTKRQQLQKWRKDILSVYSEKPTMSRLAQALVRPIQQYNLQKSDFLAVIDGMEMDVGSHFRMTDMAMLTLYCDRVACAVGRLSIRVFGVAGDKGDTIAKALGDALQLTNILRDIEEDAKNDRMYLPKDVLLKYGISEQNPSDIIAHAQFGIVFKEFVVMAGQKFSQSRILLSAENPKSVRPAVMMMEVYQRIFDKLRLRGWQPGQPRVGLNIFIKLWLVIRYGIF